MNSYKLRKPISQSKHDVETGYMKTTKYQYIPLFCEVCHIENDLQIHHSDGNQTNNTPENIKILCTTHHRQEHREIYRQSMQARWHDKEWAKKQRAMLHSKEFSRRTSEGMKRYWQRRKAREAWEKLTPTEQKEQAMKTLTELDELMSS